MSGRALFAFPPRRLTIVVPLSAPRNRIINPLRRETFSFVSRNIRLSRSLRRWYTREWHFAGNIAAHSQRRSPPKECVKTKKERVKRNAARWERTDKADFKQPLHNASGLVDSNGITGRFFTRRARAALRSVKLSSSRRANFRRRVDAILSTRALRRWSPSSDDERRRVGDDGLFRHVRHERERVKHPSGF